jgi:integrase
MVGNFPDGFEDEIEIEGALPVLNKREIRALIQAPNRHKAEGKRDAAMIAILVLGGLRAGECAGLNLTDVTNGPKGMLRLRFKTLKRKNHHRTITLPEVGSKALRSWLAVHPRMTRWLFPGNEGKAVSVRTIERRVGVYLEQIGRADLHLHSLRHTALSTLMTATSDIWRVQRQAGHATVRSTEVYLSWSVKEADANAEAMAGALRLRRKKSA